MPLDPVFAQFLQQMAPDPSAPPPTVAQMREDDLKNALMLAPDPPLAVGWVVDVVLAGVPTRVYRPETSGTVPTVVFVHGGGWAVGGLDTHDPFARRLCRDVNTVVVSVDYRLSPEHPFPAGYEDCLAVARHVADHIADFGGGEFALAGDSAGGNLAAGVAQAFRDEDRPVAAQMLLYPATDLSEEQGGYPSMREKVTGYGLTGETITMLRDWYLASDRTAGEHAPASPIRADSLRDLAPAVIGVAEYDPLCDQGLAYADALAAAGVPTWKRRYPGLVHAFINFVTIVPAADAAVAEVLTEFKEQLAKQPG